MLKGRYRRCWITPLSMTELLKRARPTFCSCALCASLSRDRSFATAMLFFLPLYTFFTQLSREPCIRLAAVTEDKCAKITEQKASQSLLEIQQKPALVIVGSGGALMRSATPQR